jgi:hypothetical protein
LALGAVSLLAATPAAAQQPKLLEPERAFAFSVQAIDESTVEARFAIANGYYLYRDKLKFLVEPVGVAGTPALPPGKMKHDEFFGNVENLPGDCRRASAAPGRATRRLRDRQGRIARLRGRGRLLSAPIAKGDRRASGARGSSRRAGLRDPAEKVLVQLKCPQKFPWV